ncbi:N2227-domain-containing protein [Lentinula aff. detonsa]|nr:N2227-domain-containing protein [Lentinula aff. detonsa]
MPLSDADIEEGKSSSLHQQRHFSNVVATFRKYSSYHLAANNRRRKDLFTLPQADQVLLDQLGYKKKLDEVDKAISANENFLNQIVVDPEIFGGDEDVPEEEDEATVPDSSSHSHSHSHSSHSHSHSHSHSPSHSHSSRKEYKPTAFDMDKLRSTLKQLVRDWSAEGQEERETSYGPMKEALLAHFSDIPEEERRNFRVLVPGSGLGRLAYDVANLGFACQGNEFSHYMLLASFLILNKTERPHMHTIYPYVHSFSNLPDRASLLRAITIPDVEPTLPRGSVFSLVAGDFEEIYGKESDPNEPQAGLWDAIMTCFFIDTAKNIVNYLRVIHKILAPGGVWINLGPLLWHWEDNNTNDPSVELDLVEVKQLARMVGFEIENERTIDATYTTNSRAMLGYTYRTAFWTAKKII